MMQFVPAWYLWLRFDGWLVRVLEEPVKKPPLTHRVTSCKTSLLFGCVKMLISDYRHFLQFIFLDVSIWFLINFSISLFICLFIYWYGWFMQLFLFFIYRFDELIFLIFKHSFLSDRCRAVILKILNFFPTLYIHVIKHIHNSFIKARNLTNALTSQPDQWLWALNSIYINKHIHIPCRISYAR